MSLGPSLALTKCDSANQQGVQMSRSKRSKRKRSRATVQPVCSVCECPDNSNYNVPDELWKKVIVSEHRQSVVCLKCFDSFAFEKGIDYADSIESLYFAGDKAVFKFRSVAARDI
jgi:hypothetical protein